MLYLGELGANRGGEVFLNTLQNGLSCSLLWKTVPVSREHETEEEEEEGERKRRENKNVGFKIYMTNTIVSHNRHSKYM